MQQEEHITESEVDIEKKKQELYSEIDALGIKSDSRINKLKKFLADRKIWHLEEMDYPILKINVDKFPEIARKFGVMSIPTIILFDNGKEIKKNIGFLSENELKEFLK